MAAGTNLAAAPLLQPVAMRAVIGCSLCASGAVRRFSKPEMQR
jgi:hypothetical protein